MHLTGFILFQQWDPSLEGYAKSRPANAPADACLASLARAIGDVGMLDLQALQR